MPEVLIGIWSVSVYSEEWAHLTMQGKLERCHEAITDLLAQRAVLEIEVGDDLSAIFVAPEYAFSQPLDDTAELQIRPEDLVLFKQHFSTHYIHEGVLVFPGTVAASKELTPERWERYRSRYVPHLAQLRDSGSDLYNQYAPRLIADQKAELKAMMRKFGAIQKRQGSLQDVSVASNTAYGYFDGAKVVAYRKRTAVTDWTDDNMVFLPGIEPRWVELAGSTFGLEICRDSAQGYLDGYRGGKFDVQMVLSATVSRQEIRRRFRKCLIHACSRAEESGIMPKGKGWQKVPKTEDRCRMHSGFPMHLYKITL